VLCCADTNITILIYWKQIGENNFGTYHGKESDESVMATTNDNILYIINYETIPSI